MTQRTRPDGSLLAEASRYWCSHEYSRLEAVANRAGIKIGTLYRIYRGLLPVSRKSAVALEEASRHYAEVPGDFMRAERLLELEENVERRRRELEQSDDAE